MAEIVKVTLVSLKDPCTACQIVADAVREVLAKLYREMPFLVMEDLVLEHPNQAGRVRGLEVEKYPALLVDDEQVTAGSIPSRKWLAVLIEKGGGQIR